jgi:hypothetical protein
MPLKGKRPVSPDQVPDEEVCFQIVWKKGEDLYCYNMMGPVMGLLASAKMRDAAFQMIKNVFVSNAAAAYGYEIEGGENVIDTDSVMSEVTQDGGLVSGGAGANIAELARTADPSFFAKVAAKLRGH